MIDWSFIFTSTPFILGGLSETLKIIFLALVLSLLLGAGVCFLTLKVRNKVISKVLFLYLSFSRSIPVIVLMYVIFYTLPYVIQATLAGLGILDIPAYHFKLPNHYAAILSLVMVYSGNYSEAFRSAYLSVGNEQVEAVKSVNLSAVTGFRRIILPQMVVNNGPAFCNVSIDLIKDSALASTIGVVDLVTKSNVIAVQGFNYIESFIIVYVIFVLLGVAFSKLVQFLIYITYSFNRQRKY